jgi:RND family efflux transporter MFP subunit
VTTGSHELARYFLPTAFKLSPCAAESIGLQIQPVTSHRLNRLVAVPGILDLPPDRRAVASARLNGTIHRILAERDQTVRAGDVVAEVASLELHTMQLDLLSTHLKLGLLRQTLDRLQAGGQSGRMAVPARQLREALSAHRGAEQRRDSLRSRLRAIGLSEEQVRAVTERGEILAAVPVRAPLSGTLVGFNAALGQAVRAEDGLFQIHDLGGIAVRAHVFERQLSDVRVGQEARARLVAHPETVAEAVIVRSGRVVSGEDRTLTLWADLRTRPETPLLPGMMARLHVIEEQSSPLLAVPVTAVLREGSHTFVFVQREDGTFERRLLRPGRSDDRIVEVRDGLRPGEMVAVQGVEGLQATWASIR